MSHLGALGYQSQQQNADGGLPSAGLSLSSATYTTTEGSHYQAYLTWINCQLKKHPKAIPSVQDIRYELQDGTVVATLIEILGNRRLSGLKWQPTPLTLPARISNYNCILRYLTLQNVTLHRSINVADLAQGNLKTQMRLIHAIAGHFKPETVTESLPVRRVTTNPYAHNNDNGSNHNCTVEVDSSSCCTAADHNNADSMKTQAPSKAGSLPSPSPLRKSKSYSNLRLPAYNPLHPKGADRGDSPIRRVTFEQTLRRCNQSQPDSDPEDDRKIHHQLDSSFEDSAEVKEIKDRLQEVVKRTVAVLLSPSTTAEEIKDILESQQKIFLSCMDSLSASNQALHADISCYRDRCLILDTAKSGLLAKLHQVEQELYRVRGELQKTQVMTLNCSSSTSSDASSSSPSLEQADFQKKMDFKNRQLAELRRELDLKQEYILQLNTHSRNYSPSLASREEEGDQEMFLPARAKPLRSAEVFPLTASLFNTKILYYLEGATTPVRCSIAKHFREICLYDVKKVINRPYAYRYYFETIDADVGRVREEVCKEDTLVPDVDGKIIVTLELASLDTHV